MAVAAVLPVKGTSVRALAPGVDQSKIVTIRSWVKSKFDRLGQAMSDKNSTHQQALYTLTM